MVCDEQGHTAYVSTLNAGCKPVLITTWDSSAPSSIDMNSPVVQGGIIDEDEEKVTEQLKLWTRRIARA